MARFSAKGQILHNANGYSARVRVGPGANDRPSFRLNVRSDDDAEKRASILAEMAIRLRPHAAPAEIRVLLSEAGNAATAKALAIVIEAVDAIASGATTTANGALSPLFPDFADEWTSGRLRARYPDHVRAKDPTRDKQVLRDFINPVLASVRVADVRLEHAERVMAALPKALAPRSRKIVAQCMAKVLAYAVYPGRYLASNPIPREWMPKIPKTANRAKACLHPAEDAALLRCTEIPIERRLAYGILAREGLRASELEGLRWSAVDLEHGRVRLDKNKTADPRAWALSPDVTRTLAWWKKRTGGEAGDRVLLLDLADGAWWLRGDVDWTPNDRTKRKGDLRTAGVTRPELFERSAHRQPIRLHDLRATFVQVSLANGKTEQWVTDRTGHRSSQMLAAYTRQARTWAELGLGTLGALDALLPEVGGADATGGECEAGEPASPFEGPNAPIGQRLGSERSHLRGLNSRPTVYEGGEGTREFTAPHENRPIRDLRSPEIEGAAPPDAQFLPNSDPLEVALRLAAEAGRFDVVAQLAKELEARRLAGSNVKELRRRTR